MIRLLFITFLAAIWFYGLPLYDMLFNHSRWNSSMVHWMTNTWSGNLFLLVGIPMVVFASVRFFLPTKNPADDSKASHDARRTIRRIAGFVANIVISKLGLSTISTGVITDHA